MLWIAQPLTVIDLTFRTMRQEMKNGMLSGSGTPYRSVFEEGASLTRYLVSFGTTERLCICHIVIAVRHIHIHDVLP